MKNWLLICLLALNLVAFSQNSALSWYKMLSGKIDKYAVTLHLHKAGHNYAGYYYYEAQQQPIYITGEDSTLKGKIQLVSYADRDEAEYFSLSLQADSLTGTWKKTEKSKALPFFARERKMPISFSYVYTEGKTRLRPRLEGSPEASFEAASVWPSGKSPVEELIKKEIRLSFSTTTKDPGGEIGTVFLARKKAFFADYVSDFKDVKNEEIKESIFYSMEQTSQLLIAFQSSKIMSLAISSYSYSGGAHGNYGTYYACFALPWNKHLVVSDVITGEGEKKLSALLEKNFRKQFRLKSTDSLIEGGLFENKIEPNQNFYITNKGIGFAYNPYEIGPYAMGEINIFIPFKELEEYMKPRFKTLID